MENASKALLIAGSVLIAILILSLLVYAFNVFSEYQTSKDELDLIEDISKFNEQFTNYDRDNVRGYELISFVNQVIDYNKRRTKAEGAVGEDKYTPVTVVIELGDKTKRKQLTREGDPQVFTYTSYTQSDTKNAFADVITPMQKIEEDFGGATAATNLAKSYDEIYNKQNDVNNVKDKPENNERNTKLNWISAAKTFNNYCENNKYDVKISDTISADFIKGHLGEINTGDTKILEKSRLNIKNALNNYYEYMQFKRCIFKSDSNAIQYDDVSGRIKYMKFTFNKIE